MPCLSGNEGFRHEFLTPSVPEVCVEWKFEVMPDVPRVETKVLLGVSRNSAQKNGNRKKFSCLVRRESI